MNQWTAQGRKKEISILIVDDVAENLRVLSGMLQQEGYVPRPVPDGVTAIQAAREEKPDLILLDIMMPDMDGYEVCRRIKKDPVLYDIPIIFISALTELFDKVKAFGWGGVDYITKPFQFEEVSARVRTHIALYRSQCELQQLVDRTVAASGEALIEMLEFIQPVLFSQARRLQRYMRMLGELLGADAREKKSWETAALLSQIGCVTLPAELLQRKWAGEALTLEEEGIFLQHVVVGADMVESIPRMGRVAELIRRQYESFRPGDDPEEWIRRGQLYLLGHHLLRMVVDYDYCCMTGQNSADAIQFMQQMKGAYSPGMVEALRMMGTQVDETGDCVTVWELENGMVLQEDVKTEEGEKVLPQATELSESLLQLLRYYHQRHPLKEPIKVLVPRKGNLAAVGEGTSSRNDEKTGELVVDGESCRVTLRGDEIQLTATEYRIVEALYEQPGRVFSRMQIAEKALGIMFDGYDRTIDVHIKNIRKKLNGDGKEDGHIQTVRGIGYRLVK